MGVGVEIGVDVAVGVGIEVGVGDSTLFSRSGCWGDTSQQICC